MILPHIYLRKNIEGMAAENKVGRKKIAEGEKKKAITVYAKKKNHVRILKAIRPIIKKIDQ